MNGAVILNVTSEKSFVNKMNGKSLKWKGHRAIEGKMRKNRTAGAEKWEKGEPEGRRQN